MADTNTRERSRYVRGIFMVVVLTVGCTGQPQLAKHGGVVSGTVECDETRLASRHGGRVVRVFAREGDWLAPGTVVVELEALELEARLLQAKASLEEALAGPRPEELASAKAQWEAIAAELEFAKNDVARMRQLYHQATASKAELEAAESKANYLEQSANAARKRYELLTAGTRVEQIEQARARVAELEALRQELLVRSPATTTVLEVLGVKLGDVVAPNQDVATVTFPNSLYVLFYIPAVWLDTVQVGKTVTVIPDACPEKKSQGRVEFISRTAEFIPRNVQTSADRIEQVYRVKVNLPQAAGIRAGMTVVGYFEGVKKVEPEYRKSGRLRVW